MTTRTRWGVLQLGDHTVMVAGDVPDAIESVLALSGGSPAGPIDLWVDVVEADDASGEEPASLWQLHRRSTGGSRSRPLSDQELIGEVLESALVAAVTDDPDSLHLHASAVRVGDVTILLLSAGPDLRRSVAGAACAAGAVPIAAELVTLAPAVTAMIGDGLAVTRGGLRPVAPSPSAHIAQQRYAAVVDAVVWLDADLVAGTIEPVHPAVAISWLARSSWDFARIGAPALDVALRSIGSASAWVIGAGAEDVRADPVVAAAEALADLPDGEAHPIWSGRDPIDARRRIGWIAGVGVAYDPTTSAVEIVESVDTDERFVRVGASVPAAVGLADGPPPWRDVAPIGSPRDRSQLVALLRAIDHAGITAVLSGPGAHLLDQPCPFPEASSISSDDSALTLLVGADDLSAAAALVNEVGPPGIEVLSSLGVLDALGIDVLAHRSVPIVVNHHVARRLHPSDLFLHACVGLTSSRGWLRSIVASAPTTAAAMDAALNRAGAIELGHVVEQSIRLVAAELGGVPEVWHAHLYGKRQRA